MDSETGVFPLSFFARLWRRIEKNGLKIRKKDNLNRLKRL